jgi:hypothetical protein
VSGGSKAALPQADAEREELKTWYQRLPEAEAEVIHQSIFDHGEWDETGGTTFADREPVIRQQIIDLLDDKKRDIGFDILGLWSRRERINILVLHQLDLQAAESLIVNGPVDPRYEQLLQTPPRLVLPLQEGLPFILLHLSARYVVNVSSGSERSLTEATCSIDSYNTHGHYEVLGVYAHPSERSARPFRSLFDQTDVLYDFLVYMSRCHTLEGAPSTMPHREEQRSAVVASLLNSVRVPGFTGSNTMRTAPSCVAKDAEGDARFQGWLSSHSGVWQDCGSIIDCLHNRDAFDPLRIVDSYSSTLAATANDTQRDTGLPTARDDAVVAPPAAAAESGTTASGATALAERPLKLLDLTLPQPNCASPSSPSAPDVVDATPLSTNPTNNTPTVLAADDGSVSERLAPLSEKNAVSDNASKAQAPKESGISKKASKKPRKEGDATQKPRKEGEGPRTRATTATMSSEEAPAQSASEPELAPLDTSAKTHRSVMKEFFDLHYNVDVTKWWDDHTQLSETTQAYAGVVVDIFLEWQALRGTGHRRGSQDEKDSSIWRPDPKPGKGKKSSPSKPHHMQLTSAYVASVGQASTKVRSQYEAIMKRRGEIESNKAARRTVPVEMPWKKFPVRWVDKLGDLKPPLFQSGAPPSKTDSHSQPSDPKGKKTKRKPPESPTQLAASRKRCKDVVDVMVVSDPAAAGSTRVTRNSQKSLIDGPSPTGSQSLPGKAKATAGPSHAAVERRTSTKRSQATPSPPPVSSAAHGKSRSGKTNKRQRSLSPKAGEDSDVDVDSSQLDSHLSHLDDSALSAEPSSELPSHSTDTLSGSGGSSNRHSQLSSPSSLSSRSRARDLQQKADEARWRSDKEARDRAADASAAMAVKLRDQDAELERLRGLLRAVDASAKGKQSETVTSGSPAPGATPTTRNSAQNPDSQRRQQPPSQTTTPASNRSNSPDAASTADGLHDGYLVGRPQDGRQPESTSLQLYRDQASPPLVPLPAFAITDPVQLMQWHDQVRSSHEASYEFRRMRRQAEERRAEEALREDQQQRLLESSQLRMLNTLGSPMSSQQPQYAIPVQQQLPFAPPQYFHGSSPHVQSSSPYGGNAYSPPASAHHSSHSNLQQQYRK